MLNKMEEKEIKEFIKFQVEFDKEQIKINQAIGNCLQALLILTLLVFILAVAIAFLLR